MSVGGLFERVLTSLQAAVLDDARWPAAAGQLDEAIGARGNFLVTGDGTDPDEVDIFFARCCYRGERNVELERAYLEVYHPVDEGMRRVRRLPDGKVVHVSSLYTANEKKTSLVYNEALPRFEAADSLIVRLEGPSGTRIVWAIADPLAGCGWSSAQLDTVRRLLPHLRQYVRIRQALFDAGALGDSFAALLENARTGVVQFDRRGRVVAANDRARGFLRSEYGLLCRDGLLSASDRAEQALLRGLLARALPRPGESRSSGSMTIRGPDARPRLVLHVTPVQHTGPEARRAGIAALGLLLGVAHRVRITPGRVAAILALTPVEGELAVALAGGRTIREIALDTGRSETTLRWHLKHIFAKLGLARQIDLVQLVASLDFMAGPSD